MLSHLLSAVGQLPGQAILVLQPAALTFLSAAGKLRPTIVDFRLGFAIDYERDCFVEAEMRSAVECDEFLSIEVKCDGHDGPGWSSRSIR